ncbi:MAG TPA: carotenoid biosynthesis protein [Terracidiphilus sp.]
MPNAILSASRSPAAQNQSRALLAILALYLVGRIIEVLPFSTPSTSVVALEILSAFAFALIHGAYYYRLRGILVFIAICLVVGNTIENIGVVTGFPFGHYKFLQLMGPKLLHVPILLGLAYIGMAYVSWTLACLILGATRPTLTGAHLIAVPLLASFIMTAWDFAQDPVWSTLLHAWRWRDGGRWFGVPFSNFAGWLLTVFLIYFAFALYLRRKPSSTPAPESAHGRTAVLLYAFCAIGNVLQLLRPQPADAVADATGTIWHTAAILRASALVSLFIMGSFALLAEIKAQKLRVSVGN